MMEVKHTLLPIYDENSKILILGTMPSPKSREAGFYYGHPQNRFWKVMASLFQETLDTKEKRTAFCYEKGIALYDVLASCTINGASDSSIKNAKPNDLSPILKTAPIQAIFTTGKKADALYHRYLESKTHLTSVCLPSTSPANAAWSLEQLVAAYQIILTYL